MVSTRSPSPPVDPSLVELFASSSTTASATAASGSGSSVGSDPRGGDDIEGKSSTSFLASLDAVACGGDLGLDSETGNTKSAPAVKGFPSLLKGPSLLFIGPDPSIVCGGNVGQTEEKFCGGQDCKVASHAHNKYDGLKPGLFVRVPSSDPDKVVVYKSPFVPLEKLQYDVVLTLIEETRSPSEWFSEFLVLASGEDEDKIDEEGLGRCREGVRNLRVAFTPGPKKGVKRERMKGGVEKEINGWIDGQNQGKLEIRGKVLGRNEGREGLRQDGQRHRCCEDTNHHQEGHVWP